MTIPKWKNLLWRGQCVGALVRWGVGMLGRWGVGVWVGGNDVNLRFWLGDRICVGLPGRV